jgi:hypothetical protein
LVARYEEGVLTAKEQMKSIFDGDDIDELIEYVGTKIECTKDYVKCRQPVVSQSYVDKFNIESYLQVRTPAEMENILIEG